MALGNDTAIESGTTLMLDAGVNDLYNWSTGETTQTIVVDSAAEYSVLVTGGNGCTNADSIIVTLFVNIDNQPQGTIPVYAFPNPSKEEVNLNIISAVAERALLKIIDATGKETLRREINLSLGINQQNIQLSGFASGGYFIHVLTKNNSRVVQIVIQ